GRSGPVRAHCRRRDYRADPRPGARRARTVARGARVMLAGHERPWREWQVALAGPRLHHGWILAGQRGLGKAAFARRAARELVAEAGAPPRTGDHPDVIVLEPLPASADEEKKRDEG